jgi:hypothetical protein
MSNLFLLIIDCHAKVMKFVERRSMAVSGERKWLKRVSNEATVEYHR